MISLNATQALVMEYCPNGDLQATDSRRHVCVCARRMMSKYPLLPALLGEAWNAWAIVRGDQSMLRQTWKTCAAWCRNPLPSKFIEVLNFVMPVIDLVARISRLSTFSLATVVLQPASQTDPGGGL